jgi:FlaA1/EpsC-like NDP-sugar epimerase
MLHLIGRDKELFTEDINQHEKELSEVVSSSRFLVIGGAGSIGQAVTKEIFKRNPRKLHVVDISENNMVELVRDIRSSFGYIDGDFQTFALDVGSVEYPKNYLFPVKQDTNCKFAAARGFLPKPVVFAKQDTDYKSAPAGEPTTFSTVPIKRETFSTKTAVL